MARRSLAIVCAILFADALLFVALTPLVPTYADEFGLSDQGAGWLVAAFGLGAVLGGVPSGIFTSRKGSRLAIVAGLAVIAASSFGLAFAGDAWTLGATRVGQGIGSVFVWAGALAYVTTTTSRRRRGQALGIAFGTAIAGAVLGPLLGGAADVAGADVAFGSVGIAMLAMTPLALVLPPGPPEHSAPGAVRTALRDRGYVAGLWLNFLLETLFATIALLVPLALDDGGFSALEIGIVFFVAGTLEVVLNPIVGHASDRYGRLVPLRIGLASAGAICLALAAAGSPSVIVVLTVAAAIGFGAMYSPALALVADRADAAGLGQGLGFGVMNSCWAAGLLVAPPVAGALAERWGDHVPYAICAALALLTLAATSGVARRRLVTT